MKNLDKLQHAFYLINDVSKKNNCSSDLREMITNSLNNIMRMIETNSPIKSTTVNKIDSNQ